jgi:hypothetical protein
MFLSFRRGGCTEAEGFLDRDTILEEPNKKVQWTSEENITQFPHGI